VLADLPYRAARVAGDPAGFTSNVAGFNPPISALVSLTHVSCLGEELKERVSAK
jgi:hypothetical protein